MLNDIYVNYRQDEKLHHIRINFRLCVLQKVGEILRANYAVSKRRKDTLNSGLTLENIGAPNHPRSALLHGHRLGQVAGLIDVATAHDGDVVAQQLQGNRIDQGAETFHGLGYFYHVIHH